jgi:hypothetical protein
MFLKQALIVVRNDVQTLVTARNGLEINYLDDWPSRRGPRPPSNENTTGLFPLHRPESLDDGGSKPFDNGQ